jgi:hypothetical protein
LLRGRQGGWLSPNDCREEMGWPAVPGGDSIDPPNTSAAAAAQSRGSLPPHSEADNVTSIEDARHAAD